MLKKIFLAFLLVPLMGAAQKPGKDTLVRYFNTLLEPVKKKEAIFIGVAIKDVSGWNAVVYNDSIKIIMRGRYLDEDCKIKDGFFAYNNNLGLRYMSGQFVRNMKTGWWFTWFPGGGIKDSIFFKNDLPDGRSYRYFESGIVESEGTYKDGKTDGEWIWYHENGQIATKEKYTNGQLESLECFDSTGMATGSNCAINRPPAIKGRYLGVEKFVKDSLRYPLEAYKKEIEGYVAVKFIVSKSGEITEPVIISSPDPTMSQEVIRVIKIIPALYPAIWHNRLVEHTFTLNIPFYIGESMLPVTEWKLPGLD